MCSNSNLINTSNGCYTDVNKVQFDYLWIIKDFSLRFKESYSSLKSSIFIGGGDERTTWRLIMYPRAPSNSEYVSVLLELVSCNQSSVKAIISISALNAKGDEVENFQNKVPHNFGVEKTFNCRQFFSRSKILDKDGALLHGDTLSILCKIDLLDRDVNVCGKSIICSLAATESLLSDDFNRLFENGKFSDVTLVVDEQEFRAHKAVLAARSHVFAAMFDHDMTETNSNRVVITDIDPDVLHEMLRFIYTNNAPSSHSLAKDLLVAADKYGLVQLMRICEFVVGRDISIETAADTLLLADSHNAKHLKALAIEYINMNATEVMETEEWRNLAKSNSHLIADAYSALINQMKNAEIREEI